MLIDLHSHLLAGVDDGPKLESESLEMARLYEKAGFCEASATPHFIPGTGWTPGVEAVREKVERLNGVMGDEGFEVKVLPGMEVAMDSAIPALLDKRRILTLGDGPYVLIECPFQRLPMGWEKLIFDVVSKGYKVLLAHPERCGQLIGKVEMFQKISESGAFIQMNYDSLLGVYGRGVKATAWELVHGGYVHCLATDSHDARMRHPGRAREAIKILKKKIGVEKTDLLTRENPRRVLRGEELVGVGD